MDVFADLSSCQQILVQEFQGSYIFCQAGISTSSMGWASNAREGNQCENHIWAKFLRIPDAQLESFTTQVQRSAKALELDSSWCSVILGMYDQAKMQYPNALLPKLMNFHVNT